MVEFFDVQYDPGCTSDVLIVQDGHLQVDCTLNHCMMLCGHYEDRILALESSTVVLQFTSNEDAVTAPGFNIEYVTSVWNDATCGDTYLTASSGTITSPGFPNNYGNSQACQWTISGQEGQVHIHATTSTFALAWLFWYWLDSFMIDNIYSVRMVCSWRSLN